MTERKVNLNTATVEELTQLLGIGPTLAERIIAYRDTVRPFEEPVEITTVPGVSEKIYRAVAERLTVGELVTSESEMVEEIEEIEVTTPEPARVEQALIRPTPAVEPEPKAEPPAPPPPTTAPPRIPSACLGYAGLIAAALLGGLFGALLALLVIGGINGTLDFGQTEAVVNTQAELDHLSIQADTLQSDLDGLRQRLDLLEGLTGRVDGVEHALDDLDTALAQTQVEVDTLNVRADQLNADIATVRAAADRFNTFLDGLRDLLFESEGVSSSPTPTLPPTTTPRPTRNPRPSPTPQPTHTPRLTPTPTGVL